VASGDVHALQADLEALGMFNYQIVNSGHGNQDDIQKALTQGANALVAGLVGSGNIWAAAATKAIEWLGGILFANCDGPVAIDQIAVTGADVQGSQPCYDGRGMPRLER
jgi:hypothetical protein